jgi:hypothetical protein
MKKTIRPSSQYSNSFTLLDEVMIENSLMSWFLYRSALKAALKSNLPTIMVGLNGPLSRKLKISSDPDFPCAITHGTTQRRKKFIQIGCMRFVGDSRRALIQWAKSGK